MGCKLNLISLEVQPRPWKLGTLGKLPIIPAQQASRTFQQINRPRLRHFVAEHRIHWDQFVQALTYACNAQVPRSGATKQFSVVQSYEVFGLITASQTILLPDNITKPPQLQRLHSFLRRMYILCWQMDAEHSIAWAPYNRNFDRTVQRTAQLNQDNTSSLEQHLCK